MPFFKPFATRIFGVPTIVYADTTLGPDTTRTQVEDMIMALNVGPRTIPKAITLLKNLDFVIAYVWRDPDCGVIFDFWIQSELATYGECGPKTDIVVFSLDQRKSLHHLGHACGNTRIVSGFEEIHRREVMKLFFGGAGTFDNYIHGERPGLPDGLIIP